MRDSGMEGDITPHLSEEEKEIFTAAALKWLQELFG